MLAVCWLVAAAQPAPAQAPVKAKDAQPDEVELLRRILAEQKQNPDKIIRTPSPTNTVAATPAQAALEREYLDGKMTAKQYRKALDKLKEDEPRAAEAAKNQPPVESRPPAPQPASVGAPPIQPAEATPQQKEKLSEVEARIDEMLRQKAAREKAALTNATGATNSVPSAPLTKRQRMDALLKQFIEGKTPEAEYNEKRAKLLAEPD